MPLMDSLSSGKPENYLRNIVLEDITAQDSRFYTALSVREILPITRRIFEENVRLAREFQVAQIVEKEKHLIIYGEAGSGKTATLKWLTSYRARNYLEKKEGFIPIYAALDSYVKGSFYDFLRKEAEKKGISEKDFKKLLEGKALLLFDGLDLLAPSGNFFPFEEISDFISEYGDCSYVIASRPGYFAIKSTFAACELEKLTDENIRDFTGKHIRDREQARIRTEKVLEEAHSNPGIRNPLMLSLRLKITTARTGTGESKIENCGPAPSGKLQFDPIPQSPMPSSRAEICRTFISGLFRNWGKGVEKKGAGAREPGRIKIENTLIDLAFKLRCENKVSCEYLYALNAAEKYGKAGASGRTGARELIQACIETGLLTRKGSEIRIGINRTFQEYFAALKLKADFENGKDISEAFRHPGWENVVTLTSEMLEPGDELVHSIISSGELWLASKCALKTGPETKKKLCSLLAGKLDSKYTVEKIRAIQSLGKPGICGTDIIAEALHDEEVLVRREAVRVLGEIGVGNDSEREAEEQSEGEPEEDLGRRLERKSEDEPGSGSGNGLAPLMGALGDEDYSVRIEAAKALGKIGSERAVELLTSAFEDEDRAVRLAATEALAQIESEKALEALVSALTSDDDYVRLGAVGALGRVKAEKAADYLIKAFREGDNFVRMGAAEALGRMKSEKAIGILTDALEDEDKFMRWIAAKALGEIESEGTHKILIDALVDENHFVRREAAKALGGISPGSEKALDSLISALTDDAGSVRKEAAEALGQLGDERAVEPLIGLLADEEQSVRMEAARALGLIECGKAVDPLLLALGDESRFVRKRAAKAIGKLEFEKTIEPLLNAYESGDNFVRREAIKILGRIKSAGIAGKMPANKMPANKVTANKIQGNEVTAGNNIPMEISHRVLDTLAKALADEDEFVRREAAKALANVSGYDSGCEPESEKEPGYEFEKVLRPLINALEDEDEDVRRLASEALGSLDPEKALQPLIAALNSGDGMVRRLAAEALGRIRSEEALQPLIELALQDEVDFVRREAARALGKIKSEKAVDPLITALTDKNNGGRWGAAEALGRMKAGKAIDPLINALYDYDDFTRWAAARALGRLKPKKAILPLINTLGDWNRFVKAEAAASLSEICTKEDETILKDLLTLENKFAANLAFEILEGIETRERAKARLFRR